MKLFDFKNKKYHIGHLILDSLKSRPNAVCQIDAATGQSETNASVLRRTVQLARCFRRYGVRPGDVLALNSRNHLNIHIPIYAALMNGMPFTGIEYGEKYTQIKACLKLCTPKIVFCQRECIDYHLSAIKELKLRTKLICFDDSEYSLKRFIEEYQDENEGIFEPMNFDLEKVYAGLISTGGTTRNLKLAAFKHRKVLATILELQNWSLYKKNSHIENKPWLFLTPVQWIAAFLRIMCLPYLNYTKVMTSAPATTEHAIDIINRYKPKATVMWHSLAYGILNSKKECDLTCFDSIMLSGDRIPISLHLKLRERIRCDAEVGEYYGQTENLGPILLPDPSGPIGNCGKRLLNGQIAKLMDPSTGNEIKQPNVPGEMWIKGVNSSEYYNNQEDTARSYLSDGWYKTGDLLIRDKEGYYFFLERLNMVVVYRNHYIFPVELESVIYKLSGIRDVIVVSIPHKEDGHIPVACIVKKFGENVTAQQIKDIVDSELADTQKQIGGVVFIEEIPFTSSGKVDRLKLQEIVLISYRK